jgi:DNA-binding NtrC family response regulator
VVPINIPSLRERKEDIPFLAEHFVQKLGRELKDEDCRISEPAIQKLLSYSWPGNVRELENVIERSLVLCPRPELQDGDIKLDTAPQKRHNDDGPQFLPDGYTLEQYEQEILREALRRANGNKSQAARLLGLTRNALRYRLSQIGLDNG